MFTVAVGYRLYSMEKSLKKGAVWENCYTAR
jgi:hypothetical protein